MTAEKLKPLRKRWPGEYAFRLVAYLPSGASLEFETHMPAEHAKAVLKTFTDAVSGRLDGTAPGAVTPAKGGE